MEDGDWGWGLGIGDWGEKLILDWKLGAGEEKLIQFKIFRF
jgi:hypothetical protein